MKILNFGSCNIDYVYSVDHIVTPGETETTDDLKLFPGGKGLNQSIAISRAGMKIYHAGCLGNDAEMLHNILSESGVDTTYIKNVDAKNGHAIIQVNKHGENSIFLYPGSNCMITTDFVDSVLDNFSEGDIILLQNEINNLEYIIENAYAKKMCIVLNPSPFNETIKKIDLNMISYLILNRIEAGEISGKNNTDDIIDFFRTNYPGLKIMLTLGSDGGVYIDKDNEIYQPIFEVTPVDTTAAGDTFTGYFIAGIAESDNYAKVLRTASCASAITVSRNGAAPSIPLKSEVILSLHKLKEKKIPTSDKVFEKINRYITENLPSANLNELSKLLGYSQVHTGNLIRKIYDKSFSKVLQDKRCDIAAEMLKYTDLSVEEIIKSTGYENESFFRKIFKEKYGKNPLDYRKNS